MVVLVLLQLLLLKLLVGVLVSANQLAQTGQPRQTGREQFRGEGQRQLKVDGSLWGNRILVVATA
jgi:hypothetical protein